MDNVNPVVEWWHAYAPSQEEMEATAAGYDFSDPEGWCKERGIDYEKALEEANAVTRKELEVVPFSPSL